jgi:hypothetical protein
MWPPWASRMAANRLGIDSTKLIKYGRHDTSHIWVCADRNASIKSSFDEMIGRWLRTNPLSIDPTFSSAFKSGDRLKNNL